ncbi:ATP-dependent DNA ligase [Microbacterium mitrae]|uniref:ATP-dependent DNA ligase n=1 Tax=Microbacterium mitrae TaxID=664640 RepID=UPI001FE885D3|nr:ATP-dependent DNA ligase [Microbacterium mitrae]
MSPGDQTVRVDGRRVRLTNLDKVLYPESGTTKGEVLNYYSLVADRLVPHVTGRPVTRKRWVNGVGTTAAPEEPFFTKQLEPGAPTWIPTRGIDHSKGEKAYPLINDRATLIALAQMASLEFHVPQWRFASDGSRANPDRLVLDLDPGPGVGLAECAIVANIAREILGGMGLELYPVTSGSKGLHLYAPLTGNQTSDEISALAHALAQAIEADNRDLVVSTMAKASRDGKVFLDWSQNSASKTTIAPYSLRGTLLPFVAAPRTWNELSDPSLKQLTLDEVLERLGQPDPLAALDPPPDRLATYRALRNRGQTPEPLPDGSVSAPAEGTRFVIHEHHATRLHWDLRLERHGVLTSWAVPKGLPADPQTNVLAIQTEDHPIEYAAFEGTIPRGQYGAGRMWIWDSGTYETEKWRDDEVIVTLHSDHGGPVATSRIVLVRTGGEGEKATWLLHRAKTMADGTPQPATTPVSKRRVEIDPAAAPVIPRPMLAVNGTEGLAAALVRRSKTEPWVEFKWDGVRALGVWQNDRLRLYARSGTDITDRYPELTARGAVVFASSRAVVDGEIVALDENNRPSFSLLQNRMHLTSATEIAHEQRRTPVQYLLFDALNDEGDLTTAPLHERRAHLEALATGSGDSLQVPPVFTDVAAAIATARKLALEGVMVKDPRSIYREGQRSDDWLKLKLTHTQDVVVGGLRPGKGSRSGTIGSLLVGVQTPAGLHYAGRVGTGLSERQLRRLLDTLAPLVTDENPFVDVPTADTRDAIWLRPERVAEVEFAEWSPSAHLRHARWRGLRDDRNPADITRET